MATTKETAATKTATTPPVPLTLQQKFIKLREAVPSITQKAHSDGVKYKFAKIFDVYQLLTPAMNEFGVNFDIVGEQATRHSENGDPIYYSNFTQHTRNGDRIVWVYEADLTIRWTNADNPDETLEVTLHAIGTNDGGPDKAKGSAWTYCLKYYLFEKFGIDQGDDDPDMSDHSSEPPQQSQKQHTGAQNGNRQGNTQPQAQNGQTGRSGAARPLSDAQLSRLYRKGEDAGYSQQSINEWILKKYGQQDPHNLTRAQYDEACAAMDNAKQQLVYICSPCRGDIEKNIEKAQRYCREAVELWDDVIPIAPHVYFTQFLDDTKQEERAAGIDMGLSLLAMCDELWVYGIENPSEGMRSEIEYAKQHQIPIRDAAELYRNREAETLPIGDALIVLPSHVGHLNGVAAIESTTVRINGEMILDLAIELRRHPGHDITLEADKGADSEVDQ